MERFSGFPAITRSSFPGVTPTVKGMAGLISGMRETTDPLAKRPRQSIEDSTLSRSPRVTGPALVAIVRVGFTQVTPG